MTGTEIVFSVIAAPLFVYALFRAAATGWYSVKLRYQRRLIAGHRGERKNGQQAG